MTRPAPPPPVLRLPSATLQVCATKENDTPRGIANRCGCKLDDLLRENEEAWPDLQGSSRMLKDTQLVLPPVLIAGESEALVGKKTPETICLD